MVVNPNWYLAGSPINPCWLSQSNKNQKKINKELNDGDDDDDDGEY